MTERDRADANRKNWETRRYRETYIRELDPIEQRMMTLLSAGRTGHQAQQELKMHRRTWDARVRMIKDKLGAETIIQAMYVWAVTQPRTLRLARQLHGDC